MDGAFAFIILQWTVILIWNVKVFFVAMYQKNISSVTNILNENVMLF